MAGARALAEQRLMSPPEQNVFGGQGEHGVPAAASPWYPGLHTHCLIVVLPSGEVAFSGHVSGEAITAAPEDEMGVYPSTVIPASTTAAWIAVVSAEGTTNDTANVSEVCCSSLRFADSSRRRIEVLVEVDAAVPVTGSWVLANESVKHPIGAERRVLMEAIATLEPVTYSGSMLMAGTHMPGVTTTNS